MVIFRSADGKPGYHQAETLEEAVAFVERLRNEEHVGDARVFRMDEVPIEFKVYYRVEVSAGTTTSAAGEAPTDEAPTEPGTPDAAAEADGDDAESSNGAGNPGRFGLFTRA